MGLQKWFDSGKFIPVVLAGQYSQQDRKIRNKCASFVFSKQCPLGFTYLDHRILEQAARKLDMSDSERARREERTQSFWAKRLMQQGSDAPPSRAGDQEGGSV